MKRLWALTWLLLAMDSGPCPAAPTSEQELGELYRTYFGQKDAAKILSLYDTVGVAPSVLANIQETTERYFARHIEEIRFEPVPRNVFDVDVPYSYTSSDGKAKMVATVTPLRQMRVQFKFQQPFRSQEAACVPPMFTMIGKNQNGYCLVAFRRQEY